MLLTKKFYLITNTQINLSKLRRKSTFVFKELIMSGYHHLLDKCLSLDMASTQQSDTPKFKIMNALLSVIMETIETAAKILSIDTPL